MSNKSDSKQDNKQFSFVEVINHIRKRPGMYIGQPNTFGLINVFQNLFDDLISQQGEIYHEFKFYSAKHFKIEIKNIAFEKMIELFNPILFSSKSNENHINNIFVLILIGVCEHIKISINNSEEIFVINGKKGLIKYKSEIKQNKTNNLVVECILDDSIFSHIHFSFEYYYNFFKQIAFLNNNLILVFKDYTTKYKQKNVFHFPNGIFEQLNYAKYINSKYFNSYLNDFKNIEIEKEEDGFQYRIGISFNDFWINDNIKTFAGNVETINGGSLKNGIIEGIYKVLNKLSKENSKILNISRKNIKKNTLIFASLKGDEYSFAGATKSELDMPKIKTAAYKMVIKELETYFIENSDNNINLILEKYIE